LRSFYEIDKDKVEQRINEEREKANRRMNNYHEELDIRMRDEMQDKDEEIECLQNELRECEQRHQNYVTQMEHELSLKQQMMETLER
jgi:polyhydroxyalkanoate synthesis regulator phasin